MAKCARLIQILAAIHNLIIRAGNSDDDLGDGDEGDAHQMEVIDPVPAENDGNAQTRDVLLQEYF